LQCCLLTSATGMQTGQPPWAQACGWARAVHQSPDSAGIGGRNHHRKRHSDRKGHAHYPNHACHRAGLDSVFYAL